MDDIDGFPEATGQRLRHDRDEVWTVTLTPEGVRLEGPERTATVELDRVQAVRQRPAAAVDGESGDGDAVFELEWSTALGEQRALVLRCRDHAAVQRLASVTADRLRELDGRQVRRRDVDWVLVVLLAAGFALGLRGLSESLPLDGTYDVAAAGTQFVFEVVTVPVLYLLVRTGVRSVRRRGG